MMYRVDYKDLDINAVEVKKSKNGYTMINGAPCELKTKFTETVTTIEHAKALLLEHLQEIQTEKSLELVELMDKISEVRAL